MSLFSKIIIGYSIEYFIEQNTFLLSIMNFISSYSILKVLIKFA